MPKSLFVGLSRDGDCSLLAASLYLLGGNTLPLDCFFFSFFFFKFITLIKSAEPRFDIRIQNKKEFTSLLVTLSSVGVVQAQGLQKWEQVEQKRN